MLTEHVAGLDCHETGKLYELIIHSEIFPIKAQSEVVTALLHRRLGTVLKL